MISTVLTKDPAQIHLDRRVYDLKDFAFELAEAFSFGHGVSALEIRFQKPDLGKTFGKIVPATFLNLG